MYTIAETVATNVNGTVIDLVARPDTGSEQREVQRAGAGVHADRLVHRQYSANSRSNAATSSPSVNCVLSSTRSHGGVNFRLDAAVLRAQVEIWNVDHHVEETGFRVLTESRKN